MRSRSISNGSGFICPRPGMACRVDAIERQPPRARAILKVRRDALISAIFRPLHGHRIGQTVEVSVSSKAAGSSMKDERRRRCLGGHMALTLYDWRLHTCDANGFTVSRPRWVGSPRRAQIVASLTILVDHSRYLAPSKSAAEFGIVSWEAPILGDTGRACRDQRTHPRWLDGEPRYFPTVD